MRVAAPVGSRGWGPGGRENTGDVRTFGRAFFGGSTGFGCRHDFRYAAVRSHRRRVITGVPPQRTRRPGDRPRGRPRQPPQRGLWRGGYIPGGETIGRLDFRFCRKQATRILKLKSTLPFRRKRIWSWANRLSFAAQSNGILRIVQHKTARLSNKPDTMSSDTMSNDTISIAYGTATISDADSARSPEARDFCTRSRLHADRVPESVAPLKLTAAGRCRPLPTATGATIGRYRYA